MQEPMQGPPAGAAPPQGAAPPGAAPPEGQEDPVAALTDLLNAMQSLHQGIAEQAPPEAVQALEAAIGAYDQFLNMMTGKGAPQGPQPVQQGSAMAGGQV